ncbi:MAG TPA: D-lyxose/D-mannose family sugar isomerase [Opitutaceae bacterium]|nr:D-lyxose/D-mannose family sugar isomerase [Opitutaceae bacterium]
MKRSEINRAYAAAVAAFGDAGWALPPQPRWDITDCGSGDFVRCGIALVNLAEEPEYSEKLIYMQPGQTIPLHTHRVKKEDIICRHGRLTVELWDGLPGDGARGRPVRVKRSGDWVTIPSGEPVTLGPGERVTLVPGVYHRFWPETADTIIGEVSTRNDDVNDNVFADPAINRFPGIVEDEPPVIQLVSDRS